ncbi:MAG: hypothetical protein IKF83_01145 [Clostridia bacterium]|nr:hypothetical protein [Clostridia bacterium]
MKIKQIIINLGISAIIGIMLGSITEIALIMNYKWLIEITQSFTVWGIIICLIAIFPRKYIFSILNPATTMTSMNIAYYMIRLVKSGYTNVPNLEMYTLTGIAGALYLGTAIYLIKNKIYLHNNDIKQQICKLLFMTIFGVIFASIGFYNSIRHNLFYNIDLGIIIGFIVSGIVSVSKGRKGIMGILNSFIYKFANELRISEIPEEYEKYFSEIQDFSSNDSIDKDTACRAMISKLKDEVYFRVRLDEEQL